MEDVEFKLLKEAYKDFADSMRRTRLGTLIIFIVEFIDKLFDLITK